MARKPQDQKTSPNPENNFKADEAATESVKPPPKKRVSQKGRPQRRPPTAKTGEAVKPAMPDEFPTTEQQVKEALDNGLSAFEIVLVDAYLTCFNGAKAYKEIRPGVAENTAQTCSSEILNRPKVKHYISKRMTAMLKRTEESQDRLLNQYQAIVYGDAAEFSEYRRECCRYCYGQGHRYQYTAGEMERAKERHEEKQDEARLNFMAAGGKYSEFKPKAFDEKGGIGFRRTAEPNPECPECEGEGVGREVLKDTRKLSPAAQVLFDGVEVTKDGIKIKHQDRSKARSEFAKILKLFDDNAKVEVSFTPEAMETMFGQRMKASRQRTQEMLQGRHDDLGEAEKEL